MAPARPVLASKPRARELVNALGGRVGALVAFALITVLYAVAIVATLLAEASLQPGFLLVNLVLYSFPLVGALVAVRRPGNAIAWLCLAIGFVWGLNGALLQSAAYASLHPGVVPRPDLVLAIGLPLWVPGMFLMGTFLLLLYPDGHVPSPRWRPLLWLSATTMVLAYVAYLLEPITYAQEGFPGLANPLGVDALASTGDWAWLPLPFCIVGSAVGLLMRYRRSVGVERLQLKWLVAAGAGAALVFLIVIVTMWAIAMAGGDTARVEVVGSAAVAFFALIPVAIGFAILRHRLYDIDRLISRTVSYTVIVVVLGVAYAGGVFVLRGLLPRESDLAVAASTLAVAALFSPLRWRVLQRVDRRFNRPRYDAGVEIQRFAGRLRTELDLDELTDDLIGVVVRTVQPSTSAMWLRGDR